MEPKQLFWNAFIKGIEDEFRWTTQDTILLIVICIVCFLLVWAIYRRWRS